MYYEVLVSKIFRKTSSLDDVLTYASEEKLAPGTIVTVPLGRSTVPGIIFRKVAKPENVKFEIKSIASVLYEKPLPRHLLDSVVWISKYYLTPIPQVVSLALPNGITVKRRAAKASAAANSASAEKAKAAQKIPLNAAQKRAIAELKEIKSCTKLLHGITGSGKTNIYLSLAAEVLGKKKSVILLVPEIALTSQLVQIFRNTFGSHITLIHSKQTDAERHLTWEKLLNSEEPQIVIGPRSALFAPVENLGLIIIDEAHENAYFQEQPPKYNALRLASFMAKNLNISCIFGTATPLVADYHLAEKNKACVSLTEKAKDSAVKPEIQIIDLKNRANFSKNRYFSDQLLEAIAENLKNHRQTMIFHNRRGSSPLTICEACGWQSLCPACFLPLTLHADSFQMVCHTCGYTGKVPTHCPECKHPEILHKGFGTKLLESELKRLFKDAKIARFDTDNTKSTSLEHLYEEVKSGEIDIVIGTQTVARGFDFPNLATVGVAQADAGLSLPDYAAEERTFHLLTQVIGRVGRGHLAEASAIIQTFQSNHPIITAAIQNDYAGFTDYLLKKRRKSHLPPFYFLAKISVVYKTERTAIAKIRKIYNELKTNSDIVVSQPTPSFHERTPSGYSWQIVVRSTSRTKLLTAIQKLSNFAEIHLSLDPPSLL